MQHTGLTLPLPWRSMETRPHHGVPATARTPSSVTKLYLRPMPCMPDPLLLASAAFCCGSPCYVTGMWLPHKHCPCPHLCRAADGYVVPYFIALLPDSWSLQQLLHWNGVRVPSPSALQVPDEEGLAPAAGHRY